MNIVRPIQQGDFAALREIAEESGIGFTSLPVNDVLLQNKIDQSLASFAPEENNRSSYLFVLEDQENGDVLGTSGIEGAVGVDDAFYHYHMGKVVHSSRELNIRNAVDILTLCNDYTGVSEICTLFIRERARKGTNGRLMSKFRFLFMQEHQQRFSDTLIAEMRGVSDKNGNSPFWQWLQEHFFSIDFPTADYLSGIGNKVFIAELMPKHPIYVSLLSEEAQKVIGRVHEKTQPALNILEKEGFRCRGYVDIFDAGPTVEASLNQIVTVQQSRKLPVRLAEADRSAEQYVVINTRISNFRGLVTQVTLDSESQTAAITSDAATALGVEAGDMIRFSPIQSK
jgi:arginine N-succinyltransferase